MSLSDVKSSLMGLIRTHGNLQLLEDRNCIVRLDNNPDAPNVKLISGGGSGHEPAHTGFVGHGMLAGAICGNIFSSPSVTAILDCLKVVASREGRVIFIVKNYTGDRLNFGIALERARSSLGFKDVRMLLVGEDCSIDDRNVRKSVGKRGLAGVVLVHKILGAMAEIGHNIDEIYSFGEGLVKNNNIATIGFTFHQDGDMLKDIEIGKGIHGEPGVYTMGATSRFEDVIDFLINKLISNVPKTAEVIVLVNNLGGTSEFLMGVFLKAFSCKVGQYYNVKRIYSGTYLSSLNQQGISVTALNLGYSTKLLEYLDFEVNVPCTLFGNSKSIQASVSKSITIDSPVLLDYSTMSEEAFVISEEFGSKLVSVIITFVCEALISCKDMLNLIDKELGDGDTGITIEKGAESIMKELKDGKLELKYPHRLMQQISIILQQEMGGSSGALYSLFFQGASNAFINHAKNHHDVNIQHWYQALKYGNDTICKYALTQLGDRTMLDALREGENRMKLSISQGLSVLNCIESFTKGCEEAARATQLMLPKSGRAAYSASSEMSKSYQYPDPGAHAVSIWARALFEACKQTIIE